MRVRRLIPGQARRKLKGEFLAFLDDLQPSPAALKYVPPAPGEEDMLIPRERDNGPLCPLGQPVPPEALWLGYGPRREEYLDSGRDHVERMRKVLADTEFDLSTAPRVLEFGCGAGRMTRWLKTEAEEREVWGCDIGGDHVLWAQRNLRPPFRFFTCTMLPNLPFPDGHFDLVYAGSVFTHIGDLAQGWILELRRILRPGGRAYITVHDRHTEALMKTPAYSSSGAARMLATYGGLPESFGAVILHRWPERPWTMVFHDHEWLKESLSPMFRVLTVEEEAYGYQTAVVAEAV